MNFKELNEQEIARVEREVYGNAMPAHNKAVLRKQLEAEDRFWLAWDVRKDNNRGHDDQ